jgi:hypothetical protein
MLDTRVFPNNTKVMGSGISSVVVQRLAFVSLTTCEFRGFNSATQSYVFGPQLPWGNMLSNDYTVQIQGFSSPFYPPPSRVPASLLPTPSTVASSIRSIFFPVPVVDLGNGLYNANYTITLSGTLSLNVKLNNVHVPGSPFPLAVQAVSYSPTVSTIYGAGVTSGFSVKLQRTVCYLQLLDTFGNVITASPSDFVRRLTFDILSDAANVTGSSLMTAGSLSALSPSFGTPYKMASMSVISQSGLTGYVVDGTGSAPYVSLFLRCVCVLSVVCCLFARAVCSGFSLVVRVF